MAGIVARVGTVDGLGAASIEIPVPDRLCDALVSNVRRHGGKPCVLPLGLAMREARIYEESVLAGPREAGEGSQHLIPKILQKINLWGGTIGMVLSASTPVATRISRWRS